MWAPDRTVHFGVPRKPIFDLVRSIAPSILIGFSSKLQMMVPRMNYASHTLILVYLQEHGFFLECGAYDGETQSNTLWFERVRHWTGLLVEADPENYRQLMSKHRKAYTVNACLNTNPYPASVSTLSGHG